MKKLCIVLAVAALLLTPVLAMADDLNPPDWVGTTNTIHAVWDTWSGFQPNNTLIVPDTFSSNPAGVFPPYIYGLNFDTPQVLGVVAGSIVFNTTNVANPVLILKADDFDNHNPEKLIRVQMTYGWGRFVSVGSTDPSATSITTIADRVAIAGHPDMVYSAWDIVIKPNPFVESIYFNLTGDCNFIVDQIVLDTKCVPAVPIPGSLLLLGSGIIGLVGVGIRRKSS